MKMELLVCAHCKKVCEDEYIRFSHGTREDGEDTVLLFCSRECWEEYFELVPRAKSEEETKKEANTLYKLVCPACRRRIRNKFE